MIDEKGAGLHPIIFNAALAQDEASYSELLARSSDRRGFGSVLTSLYHALRRAHEAGLAADVRVGASGLMHDALGRFLDRVAADEAFPPETRNMAREVRDDYLKERRLLSALAWGRQEQNRIAEARRALIAENVREATQSRKVGADRLKEGWQPPAPDARPPEKAGRGIDRWSESLRDMAGTFQNRFSLFQLAQNRHDTAAKTRLSPASAARETGRWENSAHAFGEFLDSHESSVDYFLDHTLRMGFNRMATRGKPLRIPTNPNLVLRKTAKGYRLEASFVTMIREQAVIDSFRRSIESYWTGRFEEKGRRRLFETRIRVRVLAEGEKPSPDALLLEDGMTVSGTAERRILLRRDFDFSTPAHEFGHILGLPDEYVNDYDPEGMKIVDAQNRASAMASHRGLVQARHFARVVALLRQGGRLIAPP
ncbi:MAG: hypothetical protein A2V88_01595 [Elusimicrobia bacterium RBG_16_66_12]|nr:MAG: hypothetical protein A2V88_01595 [Elusimicrobia bacterium RBG_16_66_12]